MKLIAIALARCSVLCDVSALDPFGKKSAAESLVAIRDRYNFASMPLVGAIQENTDKGAEFSSGRLDHIVIDKLTIFTNGIVVDTRSSTDNALTVATDFLATASSLLGSLVTVQRTHLANQIIFRSDMDLNKLNPVLKEISDAIDKTLESGFKQEFRASVVGITVHTDTTQTRFNPTKFTIERRAESPFSENMYFSNSPLPTDLHLELVKKFEASLL